MKYTQFINQKIKERLLVLQEPIVIYGQNVAAGSYMGGLAKDLKVNKGQILNTPNCELTLCGVGMGLMLNGVNALFICKQLDFILLGMDQLTHTWNMIKDRKGLGSFTIFTVITDSGLEGKQSCFNRLRALSECANVPSFNLEESNLIHKLALIDSILQNQMINEGFRIITVSQTLLQKEVE